MLLDILEELNCTLQLPAVDRLSSLAGVLEGDAKVGTAGAGGLRRLDLGGSVSDLVVKATPSAFHSPQSWPWLLALEPKGRRLHCQERHSNSLDR